MKRNYLIALLFGLGIYQLMEKLDNSHTLGSSKLEGTDLTVQIVQSRSVLNFLGGGVANIWIALIDSRGVWVQTQEIQVLGPEDSEWATWEAPETLSLQAKGELQVLPITLNFATGRVMNTDIVLGVLPGAKPEPAPSPEPE